MGFKTKGFKLSDQAIGALMMALQKGLLEQIDITEMLQEFDLENTDDGLVVKNPPTLKIKEPLEELEADA